ncbi:MAG: ABC transporter permease [Gemmatimonadaceae bacterium]|nr:ABC transporter permease [Gemmatimonadaceae bacterium]
MRDTRWRKVFRDLRLHRGRSITTVVAMSVGLLGASLVLNSWSLVTAATHGGYDATNPPAATLRLGATSPEQLASVLPEVERVSGVAAVHVRRTAVTRVTVRGVPRTAMLFSSDGLDAQTIGRVEYESGQWPLLASTVAIDYSSLEFAKVGLGDSIVFERQGQRTALPIATVVRDAGLPPGWMDHLVYLFVSDSVLNGIVPQPTTELRFTTEPHPTRDGTRAVSRAVVEQLALRGVTVAHTEIPEPGEHAHAGQIESFLMIQGAFGVVALLFSAVLIVNLVSAMLLSQRPLIGVMKAMGATPGQLMGMYLALAAVLGVASAVLALPLAAVGGRLYAGFVATLLNFSIEGFSVPWYVYAAQIATAVLLPVLAAAMPVRRASGMTVAEALRPPVVLDVMPQFVGLPARVRSYPAVPFALRNLWRHQRRVVLTVLTLASGGAVFLGALQLRRSIQQSVAVLYESTLRYNAMVRTEQSADMERLDNIVRAVPGVMWAEAWPTVRAAIVADGRLENRFTISAPLPETPLLHMAPTTGRWLRDTDSSALVVSRELAAAEPALADGSQVSLVINGETRRWQVVGVLSIPGRVAYANQRFVSGPLGVTAASMVAMQLANTDSTAYEATMQRVQAALEGAGVAVSGGHRMSDARASAEDHLVMVVDFLIAVAQLTVIVAALGLASTMGLAVLERTREIGVLRAVGATPRAIMAVVQAEGLLIAVVSAVVAIPLSIPMSVVLGAAFGRVMFPVPVELRPVGASVALWFAVAIVVSVLACAGPARRATRISAREALGHD